jgi:hypothetical protein
MPRAGSLLRQLDRRALTENDARQKAPVVAISVSASAAVRDLYEPGERAQAESNERAVCSPLPRAPATVEGN